MNRAKIDTITKRTRPVASHRCDGRLAFTLIELLVVVSIIALLISILLPSLRNAREQAKLVKCLGHMSGVGRTAMVFASDHRGRLQLAASEGNVRAADPGRNVYSYGDEREILCWPAALAQVDNKNYTNNWDWGVRACDYDEAKADEKFIDKDLDIFTCPSDKVILSSTYFPRHEEEVYGEGSSGLFGLGDPNNQKAPTNKMSYWGRLSFAVNEDVSGGDGADLDYWPSCWRAVPESDGTWEECNGGVMYGPVSECFRSAGARMRGKMDQIFAPGKVGLFFEAGPESIELARDRNYQYANLISSTARKSFPDMSGPYLGQAQQSHPWRIPTNRHYGGRLNVTYCDGHGGTVRATKHAYNEEVHRDLPCRYSPRVRVSPYNPHGLGEN